MCGVVCPVRSGETLVQCAGCRHGLKVMRTGGALTLVISEFESLVQSPPMGRSGSSATPLFAAVLCLAAMGIWHVTREKTGSLAPATAGATGQAAPGFPGNKPLPPDARAPVADPASAPAFRGTLPWGRQQAALFQLPGPDGGTSWTGTAGQVVPGTRWTLRTVTMWPTSVIIEVAGGKRISLALGQTYLGGAQAVKAPPPPAPKKIFNLARQNAQAQTSLSRAMAQHRLGFVAPAAAGGEAQQPAVAMPPNVRQVDASGADRTDLRNYGESGSETVVMFTSIRCGPCQATKPKLFDWARAHPASRAVLAEIGETPQHGINWAAPVIQTVGISSVPYLVILDASGNVSARGGDAHRVLGF